MSESDDRASEVLSRLARFGPNPVVIYHHGCQDGFMAAYLARKRWPGATLISAKYGDKPQLQLIQERDVLIVDFCYRDDMLAIHTLAKNLVVLDHHEKSKVHIESVPGGFYSENRSGCGLAYQFLFNGSGSSSRSDLHMFVLSMESRDLWKFDIPGSRAIHAYFSAFKYDVDMWDSILDRDYDSIVEDGNLILAYEKEIISKSVNKAFKIVWPEGELLAVNSSVCVSDVGEAVAKIAPEPLKTALVYHIDKDLNLRCSLRSSVDIGADVGEMAVKRGGGGHRHSSAFTVKGIDFEKVLTGLSKSLVSTKSLLELSP